MPSPGPTRSLAPAAGASPATATAPPHHTSAHHGSAHHGSEPAAADTSAGGPAGAFPPPPAHDLTGPAGGRTGARRAQADFERFFEDHHRDLARLAFLLLSDREAAEEVTADALTSAWMHWDRVQAADNPLAYVRRSVANLAANRIRRSVLERSVLAKLGRQQTSQATTGPDVPAVIDLQWALDQLPARKRQCVVLRYGYDMSEAETADWLGISVGTVKSQTSKAVTELERLLASGGSGSPSAAGGGRHQRRHRDSAAANRGRVASRAQGGRARQNRASAPSEPTRTAFMRLRGGEA
ncbi:SigE family RNA polymerase sigma factor [Frankia sp. CN6]|uniref:SigE family RNA polymerase sigma factor n=3 Tax=Frankia nepalensis TaxID=1836974 RepID=A0A937UQZ3_9ACTN|nr:SigE family RNA polymerase sigma factor [Frankia nepalensis]